MMPTSLAFRQCVRQLDRFHPTSGESFRSVTIRPQPGVDGDLRRGGSSLADRSYYAETGLIAEAATSAAT